MPKRHKVIESNSNSLSVNLYLRMLFIFTLMMAVRPIIAVAQSTANPLVPQENFNPENPYYGLIPRYANGNYASIHPSFPNIMALNITDIPKTCIAKKRGASEGMICTIENTTYHMKTATWQNQMRLQEMYHLDFVRNNIGVRVPNAGFFFVDDTVYIASEKIEAFTMAEPLKSRSTSEEQVTQRVLDKIGSSAVSKLTVVKTFIDDMNSLCNWGYDESKTPHELIAIDIDTRPKDLLDSAARALSFNYEKNPNKKALKFSVVDLSINNIFEMENIYKDMLNKPLPTLQVTIAEGRDLQKEYINLLQTYIHACEVTLERIKVLIPNLDPNKFSGEVNNLLAAAILDTKTPAKIEEVQAQSEKFSVSEKEIPQTIAEAPKTNPALETFVVKESRGFVNLELIVGLSGTAGALLLLALEVIKKKHAKQFFAESPNILLAQKKPAKTIEEAMPTDTISITIRR
jgi:hypothetical protein